MTPNQHPIINDISKHLILEPQEIETICASFHVHHYNRKSIIFDQGQRLDQLYYVAKGLIKLEYTDRQGKEHILGFALENWWETDLGAFFYQQETSLRLITMEKTLVYGLSKSDYDQLLLKHPRLHLYFLEKSVGGAYAAQQRILSLLSMDSTNRYQQLLQLYPDWFQRIPKTSLAKYLGVSRETLSRMLVKNTP